MLLDKVVGVQFIISITNQQTKTHGPIHPFIPKMPRRNQTLTKKSSPNLSGIRVPRIFLVPVGSGSRVAATEELSHQLAHVGNLERKII